MTAMSESQSEQGRDPDEPAVRDDHDAAGGGERAAGADDAGAGDGFPAEDVMPEDPDPDLDVMDPFGVGEDREPLEGPESSDVSDDDESRS